MLCLIRSEIAIAAVEPGRRKRASKSALASVQSVPTCSVGNLAASKPHDKATCFFLLGQISRRISNVFTWISNGSLEPLGAGLLPYRRSGRPTCWRRPCLSIALGLIYLLATAAPRYPGLPSRMRNGCTKCRGSGYATVTTMRRLCERREESRSLSGVTESLPDPRAIFRAKSGRCKAAWTSTLFFSDIARAV